MRKELGLRQFEPESRNQGAGSHFSESRRIHQPSGDPVKGGLGCLNLDLF